MLDRPVRNLERKGSMTTGAWSAALDEHDVAVRELIAICERIPAGRWHEAPALGKWSPSEVVLHLCRAYELGRDAGEAAPACDSECRRRVRGRCARSSCP